MPIAEEKSHKSGSAARRLFLLGLLAALGAAIMLLAGSPQQILAEFTSNRDWLRGWIVRLGPRAPFAFMIGYAILMTLIWVPAWMCSIIGGFLFGFWLGTLYALVGATLGATVVFLLARQGNGILTRQAGPFVRRLEGKFHSGAFSYLVVLRLVPIIPFAVVNVLPAIIGVPLRIFVLSTLLGIVPSTLIYAGLGDGLSTLGGSETHLDGAAILSRPNLLLPLLGLAVLALIPVWYRRTRKTHPPS